jgi:uncharacterized spore protein YtfJ
MENVENLLKGTVAELDRLLNARNVMGEPIDREGATVIPLVSYGFGFAVCNSGPNGGTGAGGGIRPVGVIVIDSTGVRVEGMQTSVSTLAAMPGKAVGHAVDRITEPRQRGGASDRAFDRASHGGPQG